MYKTFGTKNGLRSGEQQGLRHNKLNSSCAFRFFLSSFSPSLFFFILFLHRAGEFDVSNSQDALIRFYRPLVQILGIHIDCNWNEKYEIRRWFVVFRSNKLAIFKNMQKEETVYRRCALYRREKKGTGGGGKKKKRITP